MVIHPEINIGSRTVFARLLADTSGRGSRKSVVAEAQAEGVYQMYFFGAGAGTLERAFHLTQNYASLRVDL